MTTKNKFSVKATVYASNRSKDFDGPWAPTVEAAIAGLRAKMVKHGIQDSMLFRVFVAERCESGGAQDNRGNVYRTATVPNLKDLLDGAGLRAHNVIC